MAEIFSEPSRKFRISKLGLLEMQSAFAMKVRSGAIERKAIGLQRARLMLDIGSGAIEVFDVTDHHFTHAERLIGRHSSSRRLRTLDALQLAVALDLSGQNLLEFFVVADRALCEVAVLEGLAVINPEES